MGANYQWRLGSEVDRSNSSLLQTYKMICRSGCKCVKVCTALCQCGEQGDHELKSNKVI